MDADPQLTMFAGVLMLSARPQRKARRLSIDPYWVAMGVIWFSLGGLWIASIWDPRAVVVAHILGSTIGIAGSIWLIVVAFTDDPTEGTLCLLVPCYSLFYVIKNFDETQRAFLLQATGWMMTAASALREYGL